MYQKLKYCKYCGCSFENFKSNEIGSHTRWCDLNPKRKEQGHPAWNRGKKLTKDHRKKISEAHKRGCYDHIERATFKGKHHTKEAIEKIRNGALNSKHRRLKKEL